MKAVVYCRVSTKEQTQNLSLPTQKRACREHCERQQLEIAQTFVDEGESAKTADRPQLQRMLELCRENRGQNRMRGRLQRVAFSPGTSATTSYCARFTEQTRYHAPNSEWSGRRTAPTGKFIEGVLAASAQFDNDVKAERAQAGMLAALDLGRWTHQAPLGYRISEPPITKPHEG